MPISVIIPAYNEEAGIGRVLRELVQSPDFGPDIEVIVAANGCTDRTVEIARGFGVTVLDIPTPSKTAALNAADAIATGDERIYLDADIAISPALVRRLGEELRTPGVQAAVPRPEVDLTGSSWAVRKFYDINARLPVFQGRLFGRGCIAISRDARALFGDFPEIIADDMFLDAVVAADAKREIDTPVHIPAPRRAGDLVKRVARAKAGNDEFQEWARQEGSPKGMLADPVRGGNNTSWLQDVVLRSPRLWPAAVCYVAVVTLAERRRRSANYSARSGWGRPGGELVTSGDEQN